MQNTRLNHQAHLSAFLLLILLISTGYLASYFVNATPERITYVSAQGCYPIPTRNVTRYRMQQKVSELIFWPLDPPKTENIIDFRHANAWGEIRSEWRGWNANQPLVVEAAAFENPDARSP